MRNVYDLESGLFYIEVKSKPAAPREKHHSTIGEGLMIFGGFLVSVAAIIIAI